MFFCDELLNDDIRAGNVNVLIAVCKENKVSIVPSGINPTVKSVPFDAV